MSDVSTAYDQAATRYRDHWGPVIAPTALRVLDRLGPVLGQATDARLVDVGTGLGVLALAALERWPAIDVVGVDPSWGMRELAQEAASGDTARRLALVEGDAASIPLGDAACDAAVSSFVLQLVPDRAAALREMRRVLRPGGWLAAVTWIDDLSEFVPLTVFDELADELDLPEDPSGGETNPFASVRSAAEELRTAGYVDVDARPDAVEHPFTPASYLGLLESWERDDVFGPLDDRELRRVRAETLRRWARLPDSAFVWRAPVVTVLARRPG